MKKIKYIIFIIVAIIIDQISKHIIISNNVNITLIPNLLNFTYVQNFGAAFGTMQGANYILAIISLFICLVVIGYIIYQYKKGIIPSFGLFLILTGGIGNLIDRFFRGFVIDFIDTPFIATFNIADSLIVIGCFWLIIETLIKKE